MAQTNQIELAEKALKKHFERKRIVFWYDKGEQMRELYNDITLGGVTKVEIQNNEFTLKMRMLIEEPEQMFLVYAPYAQPEYKDNWLLDLVLSSEVFHTEMSSFHLQEIGLSYEYKTFVDEHILFFDSSERRAKLAKIVLSSDSLTVVELKVMSVVAMCEPNYDKVWYALFQEELSDKKKNKFTLMCRANFMSILWDKAQKEWAYNSTDPSIKDLLVWFIDGCHKQSIGLDVEGMTAETKLFLSRWRENIYSREVFDSWSKIVESESGVASILSALDTTQLLDSDIYSVVDKIVIRNILSHIINSTLPLETLQRWIEIRRTKYFYNRYQLIYKALDSALKLQNRINSITFNLAADADIFKNYSNDGGWYEIDKLYRHYIYYSQNAEFQDVLNPLTEHIDKIYCNRFLPELSNIWQQKVDSLSKWDGGSLFIVKQKNFYSHWVKKPYIDKGKRIFVIISDAFRYESATELRDRIIAENRYDAKLTPTLGMLPSYTQLGMAAMLPHKSLSFEKESDIVYVDGVSSQGTVNRRKILQKAYAESTAMSADDFMAMNSKDGREQFKEYKVIYIYSNTIDKIGDDKTTENRVFDATEEEFVRLTSLIKHITNMNAYNIIVTADHGYIYQNSKLENSDFTEFTPQGDIYKSNRRFVIGRNLNSSDAVNKWTGKQIGIDSDIDFLTSKSVNRIRIQGAGSKFVHGGSSLQEVVVPVLEINKKRHDTIKPVTIDVIGLPTVIKGNFQPISFYQQTIVGGKITPRKIRAAFYSKDGEQISDSVNLIFDCNDGDSKKREQKYRFTFTPQASKYSNNTVVLLLKSQIEGTTQLSEYRKYELKMMIAISSEFDF